MNKKNYLFIIWGVIVAVVIILLTIMGFMLKGKNKDYEKLEDKLLTSAKQYIDNQFLYPEGKEVVKVTSDTLIQNEFLDKLEFDGDTCTGYVEVSKDMVYQYKTYIKCKKYTTKGYQK